MFRDSQIVIIMEFVVVSSVGVKRVVCIFIVVTRYEYIRKNVPCYKKKCYARCGYRHFCDSKHSEQFLALRQ